MLAMNNINKDLIHIFVTSEEYELYKQVLGDEYKIIIGEKGLVKQREFIEQYFPENTNIVFLDDDIKSVDLNDEFSNLEDLFNTAFLFCQASNSFIWSVYPVFNRYFRFKQNV